MDPEFEWDEAKSYLNRLERGFGFDYVIKVFAGPIIETEDRRRDYGESRMSVIGAIEGDVYVVVYTPRSGRRRIISARPANRRERNAYREAYPE